MNFRLIFVVIIVKINKFNIHDDCNKLIIIGAYSIYSLNIYRTTRINMIKKKSSCFS